ncbi:YbaY family lipoprotein [Dyella acidiphila]|uniref:YbaY family lipoprotein n=1 Tax=Dyella acidiphila TaxID=2775866 RepID=A0ABR9G7J6_9GAMM|nr:YbaY family lipoprotein [Dyella acidiphila]MBE1159988.1 YbaY family lipoprotein [Dyella acidiphila]
MKIRHGLLLSAALLLAGCSWMPHFGHKDKAPQQLTLMKSLTGEVDYTLTHELPADAYLDVTLADVSKQDAPARIIATDHIAPIGASPVTFVLSYEPSALGSGVDFAVSATIKQGDRILARNDTQVSVLGRSGNEGPVRVVIAEIH